MEKETKKNTSKPNKQEAPKKEEVQKTKEALSDIFELKKIPKPEELSPMVQSWGQRKPKTKKK